MPGQRMMPGRVKCVSSAARAREMEIKMKRTMYYTCPNCGANLDAGEKCGCQEGAEEKPRISVLHMEADELKHKRGYQDGAYAELKRAFQDAERMGICGDG